jgi:hypothetical protein
MQEQDSKMKISISNRAVTNKDIEMITAELSSLNPLCLYLTGNQLNSEVLLELGKLLNNNFFLKELKIEWNNFLNIKSDFDSFCDNIIQSNLNLLSLNNNELDINFLSSINKIFKYSKVKFIDLSWNNFSEDCLDAFYESLKSNTNITSLNLVGNKFKNSQKIDKLNEILNRNRLSESKVIQPLKNEVGKKLLKLIKFYLLHIV